MAQTEFNGLGAQVKNVLSAVEGGFGVGSVLGTNITLDVQTVINTPVARNTPYNITYTDPDDGQTKTVFILHDSIPFQDKLPVNTLLTLNVPQSALYLAQTATFTIPPNAQPVWRVRLAFTEAYVLTTKKTYF
jgi:hypothetical protein